MDRRLFYYYLERFWPHAVLFVVYVVAGAIGLGIQPVGTFAPLVWPATGIALAALVLYGYYLWPAVFCAAFALEYFMGAGFFVSLGIALGNTIECVAGAYFLKQYVGFSPALARVRDNIGLIAVALGAPLVGATIGVTSLWLGDSLHAAAAAETAWISWWVGDVFGILTLTPLLTKWLPGWLFQRTPLQYLELCFVVILACGIAAFIFWMPQGSIDFDYFLFVPLTWAALRTGPRGITVTLFTTAVVAMSGTLIGQGHYANLQGLFYLQVYIGTLSMLFLTFTVIVEERKRGLQMLEGHVDDLEKALRRISLEDEAKTKFLAVLAHELRNPLAAVLSSVELLKLQCARTEDSPELLDTIDEHVRVMANLLDDLLDVSRISREKLKLKRETISLNDVLDRSVRTAQALVLRREHALTVTKPAQDIFLDADPVRVEQIILNLLSNASKYTNPHGAIQISAEREGKQAVIRVRDNGIGIPPKLLKRIFEPFFQVERGQTASEGLGVGLSLTRQLVEMHGGTVEALSNGENQGSEFIVRLPISSHIQQPRSTPPAVSTGKSLRRTQYPLKILVVDDNAGVTNAIGRLLTMRGHEVVLAYTGAEAIQKAAGLHPDVAILDIGLPDIDGYEVARSIRKHKDSLPILIALTGYGQAHDKEQAREAGFNKHLTKPAGFKEIETVIREVAQKIHGGESPHGGQKRVLTG